jgi:hypothetical protein
MAGLDRKQRVIVNKFFLFIKWSNLFLYTLNEPFSFITFSNRKFKTNTYCKTKILKYLGSAFLLFQRMILSSQSE